jgi:hypothetical protein
MLKHWANSFGTRLPSCIPPAAMAYLESILTPKARLFAYQDGFFVVAVMFFATLAPALLIRRRA